MNDKPLQIVAWAWSLLACAFFAWAYFHLAAFTRTMSDLYPGLGVQLPLSVRLVLGTCGYVYPFVLGSTAILVVVKEIIMRNKIVSLATTLAAMLVVSAAIGWLQVILYSPIVDLAEKLSK